MGCSSSKDAVPKDMRGSLVWHNRPDVFADVYEIEATLGEGSMGAVHRVIKRSQHRLLFALQHTGKTLLLEVQRITESNIVHHATNHVLQLIGLPLRYW